MPPPLARADALEGAGEDAAHPEWLQHRQHVFELDRRTDGRTAKSSWTVAVAGRPGRSPCPARRAIAPGPPPAAGALCPPDGNPARSTTPSPGARPRSSASSPSMAASAPPSARLTRSTLVERGSSFGPVNACQVEPIRVMDLAIGIGAGDELPGLDEVAFHRCRGGVTVDRRGALDHGAMLCRRIACHGRDDVGATDA